VVEKLDDVLTVDTTDRVVTSAARINPVFCTDQSMQHLLDSIFHGFTLQHAVRQTHGKSKVCTANLRRFVEIMSTENLTAYKKSTT